MTLRRGARFAEDHAQLAAEGGKPAAPALIEPDPARKIFQEAAGLPEKMGPGDQLDSETGLGGEGAATAGIEDLLVAPIGPSTLGDAATVLGLANAREQGGHRGKSEQDEAVGPQDPRILAECRLGCAQVFEDMQAHDRIEAAGLKWEWAFEVRLVQDVVAGGGEMRVIEAAVEPSPAGAEGGIGDAFEETALAARIQNMERCVQPALMFGERGGGPPIAKSSKRVAGGGGFGAEETVRGAVKGGSVEDFERPAKRIKADGRRGCRNGCDGAARRAFGRRREKHESGVEFEA